MNDRAEDGGDDDDDDDDGVIECIVEVCGMRDELVDVVVLGILRFIFNCDPKYKSLSDTEQFWISPLSTL